MAAGSDQIVACHHLWNPTSSQWEPSTGAAAASGSTQVSIREILTSSGASVMDSTEGAIKVNMVAGSAAGSTIQTISTGSVRVHQSTAADLTAAVVQGSTVWQAQVSSVAGTVTVVGVVRSTNGVAADLLAQVSGTVRSTNSVAADLLMTATPAVGAIFTVSPQAGSTFAVRPLQSSQADLRITAYQSTAGDQKVTAYQSTAGDFQVTATPVAGSTWAVRPLQSSAADLQMTATPVAGSTWNVRPLQSSAADLQMTATPVAGSTWNVRALQSSAADLNVTARNADSTGGGLIGSTKASQNQGVNGLVVRPGIPDCTYASGQAAAAGDNTILSSAATAIYVYAVTVSQISTVAQLIRLLNGSTGEMWRVRTVVPSTIGMPAWAACQSVTPPAYLFRTAAANPLVFNVTSSGVGYSVSAWRE